MTGTERVGLLREAGDLREELIKLKADILEGWSRRSIWSCLNSIHSRAVGRKKAEARLLESEINKYKGMAYPQLANVQTVNPS